MWAMRKSIFAFIFLFSSLFVSCKNASSRVRGLWLVAYPEIVSQESDLPVRLEATGTGFVPSGVTLFEEGYIEPLGNMSPVQDGTFGTFEFLLERLPAIGEHRYYAIGFDPWGEVRSLSAQVSVVVSTSTFFTSASAVGDEKPEITFTVTTDAERADHVTLYEVMKNGTEALLGTKAITAGAGGTSFDVTSNADDNGDHRYYVVIFDANEQVLWRSAEQQIFADMSGVPLIRVVATDEQGHEVTRLKKAQTVTFGITVENFPEDFAIELLENDIPAEMSHFFVAEEDGVHVYQACARTTDKTYCADLSLTVDIPGVVVALDADAEGQIDDTLTIVATVYGTAAKEAMLSRIIDGATYEYSVALQPTDDERLDEPRTATFVLPGDTLDDGMLRYYALIRSDGVYLATSQGITVSHGRFATLTLGNDETSMQLVGPVDTNAVAELQLNNFGLAGQVRVCCENDVVCSEPVALTEDMAVASVSLDFSVMNNGSYICRGTFLDADAETNDVEVVVSLSGVTLEVDVSKAVVGQTIVLTPTSRNSEDTVAVYLGNSKVCEKQRSGTSCRVTLDEAQRSGSWAFYAVVVDDRDEGEASAEVEVLAQSVVLDVVEEGRVARREDGVVIINRAGEVTFQAALHNIDLGEIAAITLVDSVNPNAPVDIPVDTLASVRTFAKEDNDSHTYTVTVWLKGAGDQNTAATTLDVRVDVNSVELSLSPVNTVFGPEDEIEVTSTYWDRFDGIDVYAVRSGQADAQAIRVGSADGSSTSIPAADLLALDPLGLGGEFELIVVVNTAGFERARSERVSVTAIGLVVAWQVAEGEKSPVSWDHVFSAAEALFLFSGETLTFTASRGPVPQDYGVEVQFLLSNDVVGTSEKEVYDYLFTWDEEGDRPITVRIVQGERTVTESDILVTAVGAGETRGMKIDVPSDACSLGDAIRFVNGDANRTNTPCTLIPRNDTLNEIALVQNVVLTKVDNEDEVTGTPTIKGDVRIYAEDSYSISGGLVVRPLRVGEDANVWLDGLTIVNGRASLMAEGGGGCIFNEGNLELTRTSVRTCLVLAADGENAFGGAIYSKGGSLKLAEFSNVADSLLQGKGGMRIAGGGIAIDGGAFDATDVGVSNNDILDNSAGANGEGLGGGIWANCLTSLNWSNVFLMDNEVRLPSGDASGGGMALVAETCEPIEGGVNLSGSWISTNRAVGKTALGGGLYLRNDDDNLAAYHVQIAKYRRSTAAIEKNLVEGTDRGFGGGMMIASSGVVVELAENETAILRNRVMVPENGLPEDFQGAGVYNGGTLEWREDSSWIAINGFCAAGPDVDVATCTIDTMLGMGTDVANHGLAILEGLCEDHIYSGLEPDVQTKVHTYADPDECH